MLEIELEARVADVEILPGTTTPAWTYNGTVPGPMIRAKLGDRVIVHFKNSLPEATTIHWHGLRVPNDMDGAPGVTQPPIESGGEFRYEIELRDAGTYWYHPHTDSSTQVGRGLYGAFIVEDPADPLKRSATTWSCSCRTWDSTSAASSCRPTAAATSATSSAARAPCCSSTARCCRR